MQLEALRKDMVAAMKAKDKERKEAISSLVSAVKKAAIDAGCRDDIPESMVDQVILKELKTAKEQIDTCPDSRQDLKAEYQFRYDVIKEYAPAQMSAEEVKAYIQEKFAEVVATKNKGMIMKNVMADMKGKADGKSSTRWLQNSANNHSWKKTKQKKQQSVRWRKNAADVNFRECLMQNSSGTKKNVCGSFWILLEKYIRSSE